MNLNLKKTLSKKRTQTKQFSLFCGDAGKNQGSLGFRNMNEIFQKEAVPSQAVLLGLH